MKHLVEMTNCVPSHIKFGENELFLFTHEYYYIACEDKIIGNLFKKYKTAFVCFNIYMN
jgi:hypothetical protein